MTRHLARWCLLVFPCWLLLAGQATALDQEFPPPEGYVNDYAQVIPSAQAKQLEQFLRNFAQQSGVEIAVVTIDSLKGGDIDDSAVRLYETWGIGKKESDEGLLILAAIEDRRARIEVGYGLEEVIPDAFAGRVLREVIFPRFRSGDYAGGLSAGVGVLANRIAQAKDIEIETATATPQVERREERAGPLAWFFRLILLIAAVALFIKNPFLFLLLFGMGGPRGRVSGGFGGGGFGGFGGGLSGGGGASGGW